MKWTDAAIGGSNSNWDVRLKHWKGVKDFHWQWWRRGSQGFSFFCSALIRGGGEMQQESATKERTSAVRQKKKK